MCYLVICTVLNTKYLLQLCILITVSEIGQAFITMSPEEFEARYDFKRPEKDSQKPIGTCVLVESQKDTVYTIAVLNIIIFNAKIVNDMSALF